MRPFNTIQAIVPPGMIDFGIGQPVMSVLPLEIFQRAAAKQFAQNDPSLLQYGLEQGDDYFRFALANYLADAYQSPCDYQQLFVTNGTSQGLDQICTLFTQPGDVVFVEEPTYFLAFQIFLDHHLTIVSIPTDEQGIVIEALEAELQRHRPALLYTIPTYQNPTGATLSYERRQRLVELSQQHGFLIAADEVYHFLNYAGTPPLPLAHFANTGSVLSLGTFSKMLAPGLRLGWVQTTPALVQKFVDSGIIASGGGLNPFTSSLVRIILEEGWQQEYLEHLRTTYRRRAKLMSDALHHYLGDWVRFAEPEGGYFFWLRLAEEIDTLALQKHAIKHNVNIRPGSKFSSRQGLHNYMRLSFAFYEDAEQTEGIKRLQKAFLEVL